METGILAAIEGLEKENAGLQPELLTTAHARELMANYARAEKLVAFGLAALSRKLADSEVAQLTGSSMGKARNVVATGKVMADSAELSGAMQQGDISLDQALEIAKAEESAPGSATELLTVAQAESFHVLREKARKTKLEAEQHKGLAQRQHAARKARSNGDELGMVHIHMELEPHVGSPIVARAEAEAQRLARKAKAAGTKEPFERHLADAYAALLSGSGKGRAKRPELVILVSHEVAKRGWTDVKEGELCKIPGVGPVSPQVAREIAQDAFLNGVFFDGVDLRNFKRYSRDPTIEVRTALELGEPPDFEGVVCVDCGNRLRPEFDHVEPRVALGPTSHRNLKPRCYRCHQAKTERDRKAGKLKPPEP
ncbi:MAG: HNH endonuclease [Actinomycetota bacterium]